MFKTHRLSFDCTPEEKKAVHIAAINADMKIGDYVKSKVFDGWTPVNGKADIEADIEAPKPAPKTPKTGKKTRVMGGRTSGRKNRTSSVIPKSLSKPSYTMVGATDDWSDLEQIIESDNVIGVDEDD